MEAWRKWARSVQAEPRRFPGTRYQGSKRRMADWIVDQVPRDTYQTVLDAFGGTGSVAYAFKCADKTVTYNDILAFNHQIGLALIENSDTTLAPADVDAIVAQPADADAASSDPRAGDTPGFIESTFSGIYFTDAENRALDRMIARIHALACPKKRALAYFALFQAALAKRPYNLFHRRNLYMRLAKVERGFGNKTTWDKSFAEHFRACAAQANDAVFDNGQHCRALCRDALDLEPGYDLVYIDPPYINHRGVGVDYRDMYHFLEGLVFYEQWPDMVDITSRHRRLVRRPDPWCSPARSRDLFARLFEHFAGSILVVSYRSDGIPSIDELTDTLHRTTGHVRIATRTPKPYALSTNKTSREVLLIANPNTSTRPRTPTHPSAT